MSISTPVWLNSAKTSCRLGTLIMLLSLYHAIVLAGQVTLSWDSNPEPNLGGYRLYYGQSSRNYTANIDVGNQTTYTQSGLEDGVTHYFAVTAYDATRTIESGFSNEASASGSALIEVGEIDINHEWQRVTFTQSFIDPIVLAKPLSFNGTDPALVRIRNIDATGFDIRLQEWDYLDGFHVLESISYLVMEYGRYTLEDGIQVEAGRFDTNHTSSFKTVTFNQTFQTTPVVLTSVSSFNGGDAVVTRIHDISNTNFQFQMQEQEANAQTHITETVSYIAWEISSGIVDNLAFEVNRTADVVTHNPYSISFQGLFADIPVFLADMQTRNGENSANLRWDYKDLFNVDVEVAEEQSMDSETEHTSEMVGYMLFSTLD